MHDRFEMSLSTGTVFGLERRNIVQRDFFMQPKSIAMSSQMARGVADSEKLQPRQTSPDRAGYLNWGKRTLDLALVIMAAPLVLPLVLLFALMLWIEGGSPFYWQSRLGRGGKEFSMLKLRSMVCNADAKLARLLENDPEMRAEWETTQKLRHDPRVTRLGALLRQTSLDELPQLWNVLRGEMSLVGPRPMMPDQLALYGDATDYTALLPGITGIWQVSTRNESSFAHRAIIDAEYRKTVSFRTDVALLFKTVSVVLRRTGC